MGRLRIALLQIAACGHDVEANRRKADEYCRHAAEAGADIALLPEMWSIGYTALDPSVWDVDHDPLRLDAAARRKRRQWQELATAPDGRFVRHFRHLARELGMAIGVTHLEAWPGAPRDTMVLVDRRGEAVLTYAKVHTCDFSLDAACTPGDAFPVCALDTAAGEVKVGAMICFDREFPESARILMLGGAEIVLVPNACEIERHRRGQLRTRAFENMVAVAMANYPAPAANGRSTVVMPTCFDRTERSQDNVLVEADDQERLVVGDIDLAALRAYRERESWGNAYRKPATYAALVDDRVAPPFVRACARR